LEKSVDDGIDERLQAEEGVPGNMSVLKGEPTQLTKNGLGSQGEIAATPIVKTGKEASMTNNMGIQRGDHEEDEIGISICTSTSNSKPPAAPANEELVGVPPETSGPESAAPPVLPCYSVGKGVSLPFGQLLPQCPNCSCSAVIAWSNRSNPRETGVLCLDHGLKCGSDIRDLVLAWNLDFRYRFISPEHEAALRAFLD
jgi:hypothetical protein